MEVALDWPKPKESFSTNSKKLRKFKKIFKLNQTVHSCIVSPTVIWLRFENVKIILVQQHIYSSDSIFSLVCYFPLHHQNNKKLACKFKKVLIRF